MEFRWSDLFGATSRNKKKTERSYNIKFELVSISDLAARI
jgi:hypothetical protein